MSTLYTLTGTHARELTNRGPRTLGTCARTKAHMRACTHELKTSKAVSSSVTIMITAVPDHSIDNYSFR